MTANPHTIAQRLDAVCARIRTAEEEYARVPGSVTLVAVSKTQPPQTIIAAYNAGQRHFGESYLNEALPKMAMLAGRDIEWHYVGAIQSNKTADIAAHFAWVHSVDRLKIAERLHHQRPASMPPLNVCIQVNVSGEIQKAGVAPDALDELVAAVAQLPRLRLRGLMTLPAPAADFTAQRRPLRALRLAYERLRTAGYDLDTLSMGMSDDLEAAIAEGATLVRVGTDIFGARPRKA